MQGQDPNLLVELYSISDTQTFVNNSVQSYYNANSTNSLDNYSFQEGNDGGIMPVLMYSTNKIAMTGNNTGFQAFNTWNLTTTELGPFTLYNSTELQLWFETLDEFSLVFSLNMNLP